MSVNIKSQKKSAFGEILIAENTPQVSGNAVYNFIPSNFRTFLDGSGTAIAEDSVFKVSSGTALGDYGTIRSFRSINYQTAQGSTVRLCAMFSNAEALTWSGAGAINLGDELSFGYNGLTFGIWHRYGGKAEIQNLTLTTGASGSETAVVTINTVVYNIPLTAGTVQHNAFEIEAYLIANGVGFEAQQLDDTVIIDFTSDGAKTGTFSFSSASAVGSFSEVTAGVTKTSTHIPRDKWNGDKLTSFDPSKGNSYSIFYQNGYGNAHFLIEDDSGTDREVHTINWANSQIIPNLSNPSIHVGFYATSIGASTPVVVECAYMAGFINGRVRPTRNPRAFGGTKSIGTTLTNILSIRTSRTYNGLHNQVEIEPLSITLTNDGNKGAIFELRANPTVAGDTDYQEAGNNLVSQVDTSGNTVTEDGRYLGAWSVARLSSTIVNLKELSIRIPPSLRLVIAAKMTSGSAADLSATITWYEDI